MLKTSRIWKLFVEGGFSRLLIGIRDYMFKYAKRHIDQNIVISILFTPLLDALHGVFIIRLRNSYVRITKEKNIFGSHLFYFPNIEHYQQLDPSIHPRYFKGGGIKVEDSDTVIDVGGFLGTTASMAARTASKVVSIEPSPKNTYCFDKNVSGQNIELHQGAAWKEEKKMSLNLGVQSANDSLLSPDDELTGRVEVQADTLSYIAEIYGLSEVDFVKIEAEGAEPEVIDGLSNMNVKKISVNCSEERDNSSPIQEVMLSLVSNGYDIVGYDDPIVYAKSKRDY